MAREVKATAYTSRHYPDRTTYTFGPEQLKAFEALIRADERNKQGEAFQQILSSVKACAIADEREEFQRWFDAVTAQHKQEILAEREACAKVCEELDAEYEAVCQMTSVMCGQAIRNRGNT
jgi:hypothetical protein